MIVGGEHGIKTDIYIFQIQQLRILREIKRVSVYFGIHVIDVKPYITIIIKC